MTVIVKKVVTPLPLLSANQPRAYLVSTMVAKHRAINATLLAVVPRAGEWQEGALRGEPAMNPARKFLAVQLLTGEATADMP